MACNKPLCKQPVSHSCERGVVVGFCLLCLGLVVHVELLARMVLDRAER
jgi:hypothetical protein